MAESSPVTVSVVVITYNHEKYIRQALDSIMMQKTRFRFEVLVGDDASTDKTPEIVKEYADRYPGIIKAYLWKHNVGATKNDYMLKMKATGKYIAQLEGDDFWTDENKLQIQVDFLEKHDEFIGCTHDYSIIDKYGKIKTDLKSFMPLTEWISPNRHYTLKDYDDWIMPGHTCTYVYRNFFLDGDFSILYKAHRMVGDRTMALLLALQGDVYRLDRQMGCYRFMIDGDGGSNWFSQEVSNPYTHYDFAVYHRRIERYARERFGADVNIRKEKQNNISYQLGSFYYRPNLTKLKCILYSMATCDFTLRGYIQLAKHIVFLPYLITIMPTIAYSLKLEVYKTNNKKLREPTWSDFNRRAKGKKIVLFGVGDNCKDFIEKYYPVYRPYIAVDNGSKFWGTIFRGVLVRSPEDLRSMDKKKLIVLITSSKYMNEIAEQLDSMGITEYYSFVNMELKKPYYLPYRFLEKLSEA